jgi:hypothetical protein
MKRKDKLRDANENQDPPEQDNRDGPGSEWVNDEEQPESRYKKSHEHCPCTTSFHFASYRVRSHVVSSLAD